jgi:tRNA pseudouridine55 synthase
LTDNTSLENPADNSIILVNKARTWSSFDVVNKLKYGLKVKKVGHAGTLDPLATGLLIVCTGKKTKQIQEIQDAEKEYTGIIGLGSITESYDLETPLIQKEDCLTLNESVIINTAEQFKGEIEQVPPAHSAVKVSGKRAYKLARKGIDPKLSPRRVEVLEFEITDIQLPDVSFRIVCSKGTYIRSIANDFGAKLKVGGYLKSLCRTRIGDYSLEDAKTVDEWIKEYDNGF